MATIFSDLQQLIERLQGQPEDVQRSIADIITEEIDEEEGILQYTPEFLADIERAKREIAEGDYIDLDTLERELRERESQ